MKMALTLAAFILTSSAFATDFYAKIDVIDCKIENGVVTRTHTFGKEFKGSATETKTVKLEGLAPFIEKAIATARELDPSETEYVYSMKHEGKTYNLSVNDSRESQAIIRMITGICR